MTRTCFFWDFSRKAWSHHLIAAERSEPQSSIKENDAVLRVVGSWSLTRILISRPWMHVRTLTFYSWLTAEPLLSQFLVQIEMESYTGHGIFSWDVAYSSSRTQHDSVRKPGRHRAWQFGGCWPANNNRKLAYFILLHPRSLHQVSMQMVLFQSLTRREPLESSQNS